MTRIKTSVVVTVFLIGSLLNNATVGGIFCGKKEPNGRLLIVSPGLFHFTTGYTGFSATPVGLGCSGLPITLADQ